MFTILSTVRGFVGWVWGLQLMAISVPVFGTVTLPGEPLGLLKLVDALLNVSFWHTNSENPSFQEDIFSIRYYSALRHSLQNNT